MNNDQTLSSVEASASPKRAFEAPQLKRVARMPVVTAGSFDLVIPNGPA